MNPPPDVIFAQKATAIVKAAGMDPRSIDLEKFRVNASLVFSRAYSAIYKERLPTILNENSSKDEKILNSQLVLDGLFTKTRNPILLQLNGMDIYQGNHKAIGVLVGILFAEGQRLWLEKIKIVESQAPQPPLEDSMDFEQNLREQVANDMLTRDEEANTLNEDDLDDSNGFAGQDIKSSLKTLNKLRSNPNIGPADLERLLSRIAFLEDQLQRKSAKKSKGTSQKVRSSKKNVGTRIADAIMRDNEINQRLFDESSEEGVFRTTHSTPRDGGGDHRTEYIRTSASSRSPTLRRPMSGTGTGIAETRKTRPVSAPSTSNRKMNKIRHPSNRLYSAALGRKEPDVTDAAPERTRVRGRNQTPEPAPPVQNNTKEKDIFDPSIHTYDWKSGRKILIAQAQVEYEERRRNKEAMNHVLAISENEVDALMGDNGRSSSPVKADYPSKSISGDVDKWLQRMRRDRYGEKKPPPKVEDVQMPEPRFFAAYQKLEDRDLIITIEHCYNCAHHNVTTRHKQDDYVNNSSTFLRTLAQIAHESGVCARVGVSRFKANVTEKCSTTDQDSRVGAFEIQIAYKQPNGKVVPKILHSKLMTRCWPSKSVLEKRFRAFIANAKVSTITQDDGENTTTSAYMANDSTEPYPVGAGPWALSPVANPAWSFALNEVQNAAGSNTPLITSASSAQLTANAIPSVQWAFDTRELSEKPPKFAIGATIRVQRMQFSAGNFERHALLGVVKEYADPNDPHSSDIIVKPMYQAQEIRVIQRNCVNLSNYEERDVQYAPDRVPVELQVLILLGKANKLLAWDVSRNDGRKDANGDLCLSRKAFYNQTRKLAWALEKKLTSRGKFLLAHPVTGEEVDIQFTYSEPVIDWVFAAFKGEGNVTALEKMVEKAAQAPPPRSPSIKHTSAANSVNPTPRSEGSNTHTATTAAPQPSSNVSTARPAQPPNTARTAVSMETTPQLFGSVVEVDDSTSHDQLGAHAYGAAMSPTMENNDDAPRVEQEPSALTMESDLLKSPGSGRTDEMLSPGAQGTGRAESETNEIPAKPVSPDDSSAPSITPAAPAPTPDEQSAVAAEPEVSPVPTHATSDSAAASGAEVPGGPAVSPVDTVPTTSTAATKPVAKASTAPAKRFSSADLLAATDQALKNKIIGALCLPNSPHDANLSAMERMSVLYQLADVLFDEAVLESDEKAELSQGTFVSILRTYGLGPLLDNQSIADALLVKANTASSTPDKPAEVEHIMNWLQAGDSVKRRAASVMEKSKSEPAVPILVSGTDSAKISAAVESLSLHAASMDLPAQSPVPLVALASAGSAKASAAPSAPLSARSATQDGPTTVSTAATEAAPSSGSAKAGSTSPRGEIATTSQPNSVRSLGAGNAATTARSTASTDDPETQARKQEEYRQSLNYQPKEMQFSTIVIEGDQLVHAFYDTVLVQVKIGKDEWTANTCMAREKGSKRRTYAVKWPEFQVAADTFRNESAFITVAVSDSAVFSANSTVPSLAGTTLGESPNSVSVPLYLLMLPSFDIIREVQVEPVVVAKSGAPPTSGTIKITIHGNSRDPKAFRTARIMSMRPQDLMNIKFDPILPLDDDGEDIYESDNESETSYSSPKKAGKASESPKDVQQNEELTRTLFPKASILHMNAAAAPAVGPSPRAEPEPIPE